MCWDRRGHALGLQTAAEAALSHNGFTQPCCPLPVRGGHGVPSSSSRWGQREGDERIPEGASAGTQVSYHLLQPPPQAVGAPPPIGLQHNPLPGGPSCPQRVPTGGSGTPLPPMPPSSAAACEQLQRRVQLKIEAGGRKAPGGDLFITSSLISAWESQRWGLGGRGGGEAGIWGAEAVLTAPLLQPSCPRTPCWGHMAQTGEHLLVSAGAPGPTQCMGGSVGGAETGLGPRSSTKGAEIQGCGAGTSELVEPSAQGGLGQCLGGTPPMPVLLPHGHPMSAEPSFGRVLPHAGPAGTVEGGEDIRGSGGAWRKTGGWHPWGHRDAHTTPGRAAMWGIPCNGGCPGVSLRGKQRETLLQPEDLGPVVDRGLGDNRDTGTAGTAAAAASPGLGRFPPAFPDPTQTASPTLPQRMGTQRCHPAVPTAGSPRRWHLPPPPQDPLSHPVPGYGHRSTRDALPVPIAMGARGPRAPPPPPPPSPDKGTAPAAPAAPPSPLDSAAGQSRHAWLPPTGRARTPCPGGGWGCPAVPAALEGWGNPELLQPLRGAAAPGCGEVPPRPPPRAQGPKVMGKGREGLGGDPAAHPPAASMGEKRGAENAAGPRALTPDFEMANTAHGPGDTTGTRRGHRGPAPDPTALTAPRTGTAVTARDPTAGSPGASPLPPPHPVTSASR